MRIFKFIKSLFIKKCDHYLNYGYSIKNPVGNYSFSREGHFIFDLKTEKILHRNKCIICDEYLFIEEEYYNKIDDIFKNKEQKDKE